MVDHSFGDSSFDGSKALPLQLSRSVELETHKVGWINGPRLPNIQRLILTMELLASELQDFELRGFETSEDFTSAHPKTPEPLISEHFHVTPGDIITSRHLDATKLQISSFHSLMNHFFWSVKSLDFTIWHHMSTVTIRAPPSMLERRATW
jgi:hypothetical protein